MDLSALLAREGIQADDADVLVAWARQRAAALVERIEPDSALAQQLGAILEHARSVGDAGLDTPVVMPRQSSRSAPRMMNRSVSRPHLGAAVEAALTRSEPAPEASEVEISVEEASPPVVAAPAPAPAPTPAPVEVAPEPEPEPEAEDASIGGFNRFAFAFRRRAVETPPSHTVETPPSAAEDEPARPTLSRGFELHAEASNSGSWQVSDLDLPAPPGFEARASKQRPIGLPSDAEGSGLLVIGIPNDAEGSGLLVVGIPDDEGIDIPVLRPRPRSESRSIIIPVSATPPSDTRPEPEAARSSEVLELDSGVFDLDINLDIPEAPIREATRPQTMARSISPPPPPPPARSGRPASQSGPLASASRPPSAPLASAPHPDSAPPSAPLASTPRPDSAPHPAPPPPARSSSRGRSKVPTAEPKQVVEPAPKPAKKAGKGRKKVVELGTPVAVVHEPMLAPAPAPAPRRASIGNHVPTGEPSAGPEIPSYLQDDDE